MAKEEMTSSVETIEIEAEKILEEARSRANEILLKANEEASKILSVKLPMDKVQKEREQIIGKAREQANKEIEGAKRKAAEIRSTSNKKTGEIAKRIVSIITGAELK